MNIAINARDAMPSGGYPHIEASAHSPTHESVDGNTEGLVMIRVTDTGTGIAPEFLSKVCDPFFSTKGLNVTGLGLSMVHGFARQSGGMLHITSEQGKAPAWNFGCHGHRRYPTSAGCPSAPAPTSASKTPLMFLFRIRHNERRRAICRQLPGSPPVRLMGADLESAQIKQQNHDRS